MSWEKQIQKDREDRMNSVKYVLNLNNERDNLLQKGVMSQFQGLSSLPLSKKGSEIKEKLQSEKMKIGMLILSNSEKLSGLKKEIGVFPQDSEEDGKLRYGYSQIYSNTSEPLSELSLKMQEFNRCIYKQEGYITQSKQINTLMENIQENKMYDLPVRVLSDLGF